MHRLTPLLIVFTLLLATCGQPRSAPAEGQPLAPISITWHATVTDKHTGQLVQAVIYVDNQRMAE